jgi:type IV secretory pathway protease TraF
MSSCDFKVRSAVEKIMKNGKGIVVVIGNTFTGKTYCCNKILADLGIQQVDIDYDEIKTQGMKKLILQYSSNSNPDNIVGFYGKKSLSTHLVNGSKIFYCDALESYSNHKSILTFLKGVGGPALITVDKNIVISAHSLVERIWWDGPRRNLTDWKGDKITTNPRDLYIMMTSLKQSTDTAIRCLDTDPFILTQYLHEEVYDGGWMTNEKAIIVSNLFSDYDTMRMKDWEGNGLMSVTPVNNELLIRQIRYERGIDSMFPKRWFPSHLGKNAQIQRNKTELLKLTRQVNSLPETLLMFVFKEGRGWFYKSKPVLNHLFGTKTQPGAIRDLISIDEFRRVLVLLGLTDLTDSEAKSVL